MRRKLAVVAAGIVLGGFAVWLLLSEGAASRGSDSADEPAASATNETESPASVTLDAEARELGGVLTAPLAAAEAPQEASGFARVLDPAPLAALAYERASARALLDVSQREYQRASLLHRNRENASDRELEAAEAAQVRDRVALDAIRARLVGEWGAALAERADLPELVRRLAAREAALVRLDLPLGEVPDAEPNGARVAPFDGAEPGVPAELLGPAPTSNPAIQGRGYLLLVTRDAPAPGSPLRGWLTLPGPPLRGVLVPRGALLRYAGQVFVYVAHGEDSFERRVVVLERALAEGWLVRTGLTAGERVVVEGAPLLLSAELGAPEEED